jgi:hypothetical protein
VTGDALRCYRHCDWGLDADALRADAHDECQDVGRAARRAGYEAIRIPSAAGTGPNLAVFLDRLHPGSTVQVVESRALDPADPDPQPPTLPGLEPPDR